MKINIAFIVVVLLIAACNGKNGNKDNGQIDTLSYFDPMHEKGGVDSASVFKHSILLLQEKGYSISLDTLKFDFAEKELPQFINKNKQEIVKGKFYLITDSATVFGRIKSVIDCLKLHGIENYKVINVQNYFYQPDPIDSSSVFNN